MRLSWSHGKAKARVDPTEYGGARARGRGRRSQRERSIPEIASNKSL